MLQNACLYDLQPPLLLRRASAASAAVPAPTGWPSVRHAWRQLPIRHHCCSAQRDTTAGAAAAAAAQPPPPSRQAAPGSSSSAAGIGVLMSLATPPQQQLPPLSLQETLSAVAMPATGRNLGARVEHIQVAAAGQLSAVVASALHLPQPFIQELIRFGSVHYCPVMPPPSPKVRVGGVGGVAAVPALRIAPTCLVPRPVCKRGCAGGAAHVAAAPAAHSGAAGGRQGPPRPQLAGGDAAAHDHRLPCGGGRLRAGERVWGEAARRAAFCSGGTLVAPQCVRVWLLPAEQVHVHPKRFPAAAAYDWRTRVLVHTPQYVVVDKPPGVQVRGGVWPGALSSRLARCSKAACSLANAGLVLATQPAHILSPRCLPRLTMCWRA
jgi:hypothetical protein